MSQCDFKSHNCDSIPLFYYFYVFVYYLNAKTQAMHHLFFYLRSLDHNFVFAWYSDAFSVIESQVVTDDTFYLFAFELCLL